MLTVGVQPVEQAAYDAIVQLGTKGGWEPLVAPVKKMKAKGGDRAEVIGGTDETLEDETDKPGLVDAVQPQNGRKRGARTTKTGGNSPKQASRRSKRNKT